MRRKSKGRLARAKIDSVNDQMPAIAVGLFIEYGARGGHSPLVRDDQPGAAVTPVYSEAGNDSQLLAGGAVKRINVAPVRVIPEVIFYQDLHPYLPLLHNRIIRDERLRRKFKRDVRCQTPDVSGWLHALSHAGP